MTAAVGKDVEALAQRFVAALANQLQARVENSSRHPGTLVAVIHD